jgi:hypothetical protein
VAANFFFRSTPRTRTVLAGAGSVRQVTQHSEHMEHLVHTNFNISDVSMVLEIIFRELRGGVSSFGKN